MEWVVAANAVSTWFMTGLIWFVQLVHYPLLAAVPPDSLSPVAEAHQQRTAWVVSIPMLVEGLTTLWLMFDRPGEVGWAWAWAGGVCVAVWVVSTVMFSVPRHQRMLQEPDAALGRSLVRTNWPRTLAWSAHATITAVMAALIVRSHR